jgi:hypothetical protein
MKRKRFIETFLHSGGFSEEPVPSGCSECAHTHLFRSESGSPIFAVAHRNGARGQVPSQLIIELTYAALTFIKTVEVSDEEDLQRTFHQWCVDHDGVNTPEQQAANRAALQAFRDILPTRARHRH